MELESLEPGQILSKEIFLVGDANLSVDRRGQNYYSLVLNHDGGRQIDGKVWSDNIGDRIEPGNAVEVLARVDEYRGRLQLNVQQYRVLEEGEYDPSRYVRSTSIDVDEAFDTMFNWEREEFTNPHFKALMKALRERESFVQDFKISPAASFHHHNYRGGLIEHTFEVWRLADSIYGCYGDQMDRELLLAGAALHDVGKMKSYDLQAGVSRHTDHGRLLDHIFISASMISNLWDSVVRPEVEGEKAEKAARYKALLLHILLSHHGSREWGSPVLPQVPEAVLIHYCDQISASMRSCFDAVEVVPDEESWTEKVYIMDSPRKLFVNPRESEDF